MPVRSKLLRLVNASDALTEKHAHVAYLVELSVTETAPTTITVPQKLSPFHRLDFRNN